MNIYKRILNENNGEQFYTGVVATLNPLTVKFFADDTAISVVPTSNLFGITVGSKLVMAKIDNQFFAVGVVGSPKIDCIEIIKTTEQIITNTDWTKIQFDSINKQTGSNFSFDSYGIKIGSGISKVKIDLSVWMHCESEDSYSAIHIYKNSTSLSYSILPKRNTVTAGTYLTDKWRTQNSFAFIDVSKDDHIYGYANFFVGDAGNKIDNYSGANKLIVQAIEYNLT